MGLRFKEPRLLVFPPPPEELPLLEMYSDNFRFCQAVRFRTAAVMIEASRAARRPFRRRSVLWSVRPTHGDGRARRSTAAPYGAALLTASKRARSALSPRAFPRDDASSISPVLGELRCRGWLGSNTRRVRIARVDREVRINILNYLVYT